MRIDASSSKRERHPRGTILVMGAFVLVVMLGFTALAVDVGIIASTHAQLQTVSDAAALAGARQLVSDRRLSTTITDITPEINAAVAKAIAVGSENTVAGQAVQLTSTNIVVGYINDDPPSPNPNTAISTASPLKFNSVQVTASYTVPALFSSVFRSTGSTVTATSTATVGIYPIGGYNGNLGLNASILPLTLDQATYNAMLQGTTTDQYTFTSSNYNPPTNNGVTSGADGVKESRAFPVGTGSPGNFGTLSFDGKGGGGASALKAEIVSGMTPTQISADLPVPSMFYAQSGLASTMGNPSGSSPLDSIIGKAVSLPIWDTTNGANGANLQYHIVSFASVRIMAVNFQGSNKYVIVQPAIVTDPTAIPNTGTASSWTNGGVVFLHLSR